ncbi:MAG: SIMPL domain-containing protein [Methanomicrobia archaeon]|nr:SIMPL domain-containing protein [Methanomicrobia archaeon]
MKKNVIFVAGLLLGMVLIMALAIFLSPSVSEQEAYNKTIEVRGSGLVKATPDEARVLIAVVNEAKTAQDAAALNAANMTRIFEELETAGITDVKTLQYSITPVYTWIEVETLRGKEQKSEIVGYRATNMIEAVCVPDDAGTAVDAAVRGGANRIDSISFQLTESLQERVYHDALRKAVSNARGKADVVAASMGIDRISPVRIVVEDYYYYPIVRETLPVPSPVPAGGVSTPITPSEVEVSAQVSIVYAF